MRASVLNVGLYRSGSTSLATAAAIGGWRVYREFPSLSKQTLRHILLDPTVAVKEWWSSNGKHEMLDLVKTYDLVGDGFVSLFPFLPVDEIQSFVKNAMREGIKIIFVATQRGLEQTVLSELHHWVRENLEERTGLSVENRCLLEENLRVRAERHQRRLETFPCDLVILKLEEKSEWAYSLERLFGQVKEETKPIDWNKALQQAGHQNKNPPRPVEGVLLTMRIGNDSQEAKLKISRLLSSLNQDKLCQYQLTSDFNLADKSCLVDRSTHIE